MSIYEDTVGLESFLQKGLHISQHLTGCQTENPSIAAASPGNVPPAPEPMQTDSYHLSSTERARHSRTVPFCPVRSTCSAVSTVQIHPDVSSIPHIDARLIYLSQSFPVKVLVQHKDLWWKSNTSFTISAMGQGFIRPSNSLAASSFFFVVKKDGAYAPVLIIVHSLPRQSNSPIFFLWCQPL